MNRGPAGQRSWRRVRVGFHRGHRVASVSRLGSGRVGRLPVFWAAGTSFGTSVTACPTTFHLSSAPFAPVSRAFQENQLGLRCGRRPCECPPR